MAFLAALLTNCIDVRRQSAQRSALVLFNGLWRIQLGNLKIWIHSNQDVGNKRLQHKATWAAGKHPMNAFLFFVRQPFLDFFLINKKMASPLFFCYVYLFIYLFLMRLFFFIVITGLFYHLIIFYFKNL